MKNNPEYFTSGSSEGKTVDLTEAGYFGSTIKHLPIPTTNPYDRTVGFIFNNSLYNVGNYPKGYIRGKRSVLYTGPLNNTIDAISSGGIWYANLHQNLTGRGTYMNFDRFSRILVKYTDVDPYAAMSCRCVKQEDNGTSRGPLPGIPVTQSALKKAENIFDRKDIIGMSQQNKITVFPNPVTDMVHIDVTDEKDYYFQVYNMAGQMVKEGKFANKQTDLSTLPPGSYLIRINNAESVVKIVKL